MVFPEISRSCVQRRAKRGIRLQSLPQPGGAEVERLAALGFPKEMAAQAIDGEGETCHL